MLRKILLTLLVLIVLGAVAFFSLAPGIIDKSMNKVVHVAQPDQKVSWYDSIPFIADLHNASLLYIQRFKVYTIQSRMEAFLYIRKTICIYVSSACAFYTFLRLLRA